MDTTNPFDELCLRASENVGYGRLPIPQPRDQQILDLLQEWSERRQSPSHEGVTRISEGTAQTLVTFAERMASHAVRQGEASVLSAALLALRLAEDAADRREVIPILSLIHDAAARIPVSPESLFEAAANSGPFAESAMLKGFLRRASADQQIELMGYSVGADSEGFRYQRNW